MTERVQLLTLKELLDNYPPREEKIDSDTYLGAKTPVKTSAIVARLPSPRPDEKGKIVFVVPGSAKFVQGSKKTQNGSV